MENPRDVLRMGRWDAMRGSAARCPGRSAARARRRTEVGGPMRGLWCDLPTAARKPAVPTVARPGMGGAPLADRVLADPCGVRAVRRAAGGDAGVGGAVPAADAA